MGTSCFWLPSPVPGKHGLRPGWAPWNGTPWALAGQLGIKQWALQEGKPGCILALPLIAAYPWTNFQTFLYLSVQIYNTGVPTWVTMSVQGNNTVLSPGAGAGVIFTMPVSFPMPACPAGRLVVLAASLKTWFLGDLQPGELRHCSPRE